MGERKVLYPRATITEKTIFIPATKRVSKIINLENRQTVDRDRCRAVEIWILDNFFYEHNETSNEVRAMPAFQFPIAQSNEITYVKFDRIHDTQEMTAFPIIPPVCIHTVKEILITSKVCMCVDPIVVNDKIYIENSTNIQSDIDLGKSMVAIVKFRFLWKLWKQIPINARL